MSSYLSSDLLSKKTSKYNLLIKHLKSPKPKAKMVLNQTESGNVTIGSVATSPQNDNLQESGGDDSGGKEL